MSAVLGVDVGSVRVGIAASDETRLIATPLESLQRRDRRALMSRITAIAAEREATTAVVGLPRMLDGSEGDAARAARAFGDELAADTGLAVEYWDERFTTAEAERSMIAAGIRREARRKRIDAVAAALILQGWLNSRKHHR